MFNPIDTGKHQLKEKPSLADTVKSSVYRHV